MLDSHKLQLAEALAIALGSLALFYAVQSAVRQAHSVYLENAVFIVRGVSAAGRDPSSAGTVSRHDPAT